MSAIEAPSAGQAIALFARSELRKIWRGRKLRVGAIATALVVFVSVASHHAAGHDVGAERAAELGTASVLGALDTGFSRLLVFLLPFLFCGGMISEEARMRTLSFLSTRAAGRVPMLLGKLSAGLLCTLSLLWIGGLLIHLLTLVTAPVALVESFPQTLRALAACSLGATCFCAIAAMWSAFTPQNATGMIALHFVIFELLLSILPGGIRLLSLSNYMRSLAGFEPGGASQIVEIFQTAWWIDLSVLSAAGAALTLILLLASRSEFQIHQA